MNLQSHTPVTNVSERDADGWLTIHTNRGSIRARTVIHTTNRWASHLLPEFTKLILPNRGTIAAIKAPSGFLKHTGAQHWDASVNVRLQPTHSIDDLNIPQNYHLQLPPPYNTIIIGGARQLLVHTPDDCVLNDGEDQHISGVAEFFQSWPASDVAAWPLPNPAELGKEAGEGGCWTGGS